MFRKNAGKLILSTLLIILAISITACGILGDKNINKKPSITITSYVGEENPDSNAVFSFQQKINWFAEDSDGVVVGYAYRILDKDNHPIRTAGNDVIDSTGVDTPQALKDLSSTYGWVYHYKKGADETIPLNNIEAKKSIFTDDVYAIINFPANINGDSANVISKFEIVAIDNRGDFSPIVTKYFNSKSNVPEVFASSSRGAFKLSTSNNVGMGIKVVFTMKDKDPYISATPWYFKYKMEKVRLSDDFVLEESIWFSTENTDNVKETKLTKDTNPSLSPDYPSIDAEDPETKTRLLVYAVDLAGIKSEIKTYEFYVSDKYSPQTLVYEKKCYALGEYHYSEKQDPGTPDVMPYITSPSGTIVACPFYSQPTTNYVGTDVIPTPTDFNYSIVGNEDTNIWLRWGFKGEYLEDNPDQKKVMVLRDENSVNYFSEVTAFLIQIDGKRYDFGPLNQPGMQTEADWLEIPVNHEISQKILLNNLAPGMHTFRVKVKDLQGKSDPTPAEFKFEIFAPKPLTERSGILLISDQNSSSPLEVIKAKFKNAMPENTPVTFVHIKKLSSVLSENPKMKFNNNRVLAPSFLQDFKYIIYYTDAMLMGETSLISEINGLRIYLKNDGNLIVSGGANISTTADAMYKTNELAFAQYFGLPTPTISPNPSKIKLLTNSMANFPYFIGANGESPFQNVALDTETSPSNIVNNKKGLGTVTYFDESENSINGLVIYRFKCKPTSSQISPPDAAMFNELDNKPIGIMKQNGNGNAYMFGFPLSYLVDDDLKALINEIVK